MKKSGFTLAELLISLGITGVITALIATALVTLQPDQKKAIYLRNYDALTKAVKALAGNSRLFPVCQDNLNCQAHPLFNTATGIDSRFASIGAGDGKLCKGLSYMMNGQMLPQLNCENQPIAYSDGNWTPSFRTYRTEWLVSTLRELNGSSATYQSDVYFDLNGPEGPNCVYSDSCQNPDRFKFLVAADGTVIPADPVGQEYILKRKNWRKSKLSIAEDSTTKENLLANLRTFNLTPCHEESGGNNGNSDPNAPNEHFLYIPCGLHFAGIIINCYSKESIYKDSISFTDNFSKLEYPVLLGPEIFSFDYPVASKLLIERYSPEPFIIEIKDGIGGGVSFDLFEETELVITSSTININTSNGIENEFYFERHMEPNEVKIEYPRSFEDIKNRLKYQFVCVGEFMDNCAYRVSYEERFLKNIEFARLEAGSRSNQVRGYAGAEHKCTPLKDNRYVYLYKTFDIKQELSDDVLELYYAIYGKIPELSSNASEYDKYKHFINELINTDDNTGYYKEFREGLKKDLNDGYNVIISIKGLKGTSGNYSWINAKELNLK